MQMSLVAARAAADVSRHWELSRFARIARGFFRSTRREGQHGGISTLTCWPAQIEARPHLASCSAERVMGSLMVIPKFRPGAYKVLSRLKRAKARTRT